MSGCAFLRLGCYYTVLSPAESGALVVPLFRVDVDRRYVVARPSQARFRGFRLLGRIGSDESG